MEFGLLGPLVVRSGGSVLGVTQGNQRVLLATLLLRANRAVPADEIAEILWGTQVPPSAPVTIRNYVKRLRRALGEAGQGRISARQGGYLISVGEDELDVRRFANLVAAARAAVRIRSWEQAAARAQEGLTLWRGEPLADIGSDALARREGPRLAELRLQALETRAEAELRLGRHREVLAELQRLAADHPLREHLRALLILALYRCGRRADALATFRQARAMVVGELGAEPNRELQKLHEQILADDAALDLPEHAGDQASNEGNGTALGVKASTIAPGTEVADVAPPVPQQLPPAAAGFAGRSAELETLARMLSRAGGGAPGTVVISAISGTAGVGKTALAIHFAHQIAGQFPDGQLYVNLRGFDSSDPPAAPEAAIRGFLDALGVLPEQIPHAAQAQEGLYRSLLASKKMLIVADNARDEQQVRPLLPASPGSMVIITSRNQPSGLAAAEGAGLITLDVLGHDEAVHMLTRRLGARAAAEPDAIAEIAGLCAWLPLALAVAAARAAARPVSFPLAALAAELRDTATRLDALDSGDPAASVRAVFSWSCQQLTPGGARMFRLLGLHPGPDISAAAAASLAGIDEAEAGHLLTELVHAHLLAEQVYRRFSFHDLLRAYAAEQARVTDSDTHRREALGRVLDHYLHTAASAALLLDPAKEPVILAPPRAGTALRQPADHQQALAWFQAEHQVLIAAITLAAEFGFDTHAWQLAWAMAPFLRTRGHWQEWSATQRVALTAATRLGDTAAQALCSRLLAFACWYLDDYDESSRLYADSLALYQRLGDRLGEAKVHQNLSVLAERQGRYADALGHAEQALRLYQAIGDKASEAEALNSAGWSHGLLGDYQEARALCRKALTLCAEVGQRRPEGHAWDSLGYAEHHLDNFAEAAACYQRALSLFREFGDRFYEAETLTHLGDTHHAAGELPQAQDAWQQALTILDDLQHPGADQVRAKLAAARSATPASTR